MRMGDHGVDLERGEHRLLRVRNRLVWLEDAVLEPEHVSRCDARERSAAIRIRGGRVPEIAERRSESLGRPPREPVSSDEVELARARFGQGFGGERIDPGGEDLTRERASDLDGDLALQCELVS